MTSLRKKISHNFTLREFVNNDLDGWKNLPEDAQDTFLGRFEQMSAELETLRTHIGGPIFITSGFRSPAHNRAVGGSPSSDHPKGFAVDIQRPGIEPQKVYARLRSLYSHGLIHFDQIILYPKHVHIGIGPRMRGLAMTKPPR